MIYFHILLLHEYYEFVFSFICSGYTMQEFIFLQNSQCITRTGKSGENVWSTSPDKIFISTNDLIPLVDKIKTLFECLIRSLGVCAKK